VGGGGGGGGRGADNDNFNRVHNAYRAIFARRGYRTRRQVHAVLLYFSY
jgi:hypothetical protein